MSGAVGYSLGWIARAWITSNTALMHLGMVLMETIWISVGPILHLIAVTGLSMNMLVLSARESFQSSELSEHLVVERSPCQDWLQSPETVIEY